MPPDSRGPEWRDLAAELRALLRDFAAFAGKRGVLAAAFVALGALFEGLGLALIVPLLGIVSGSGPELGHIERSARAAFRVFHVESPIGQLQILLALFGAVVVVRAIVIYVRDVMVADLQSGFVEAVRLRIAEQLSAAPWAELARLRYARITHAMSADLQRVGAAIFFALQCAVSIAMLAAQCALVLLLAPTLALLAICILLAGAVVVIPAVRRMHGLGGVVTGANLSLLNATAQFLNGLKLAVSQNLQSGFLAEFRQALREMRVRQVEFTRRQSGSRLVLTTLSALAGASLVLIGFGAFHVAPATLITLLLVLVRMSAPTNQLLLGVQQMAHSLAAYTAVKSLEGDLASLPQERAEPQPLPAVGEGAIAFDHVTFLHETAAEGPARGVQDISLIVRPREMIGIDGPSGAGKTTFADLLVGLLVPQQGRITVAGSVLQGAALKSWRDSIAYISQDPFLFHDTVRRNLAWASPRASEAEMWTALALAGADELVKRMAHGLETVVGERGMLVSGGERQRLALARAVLRKPRLLVMDEATSAIDPAGERLILAQLRGLSPRPTIVTIAHRTESLALCDRIIRIEGGHCLEDRGVPMPPLRAVD